MTTKLQAMPYAQALIIRNNNGKIALVSYTTTVIVLDALTGWVRCFGTYSQTTKKHISAFCKEIGLGLNYYLMKKIYEENLGYNVYTGELIEIQ